MEEIMSFDDLARKEGETVTPWEPDEEFMREFREYMEESIRQSRINAAKALESAREIIIF